MEFSPSLVAAMFAAIAGGFVRGFSGFGGALIFTPVAGAAFGPQVAVPIFLVMDYALTLPMVVRAIRLCNWSTVLPAAKAKLDDLRGPSGNYRAPMIRKGKTLVVGFNAEILDDVL